MAKIKKTDNTRCWPGYGKKQNHHALLVDMENSTASLENWLVFNKLNLYLMYFDPTVAVLGIYMKNTSTQIYT